MKTFARRSTMALAIAVFSMACADAATSPSDKRLLVPDGVSSAVSNSIHSFPPGFPNIAAGDVEVCKTTNAITPGIPVADRTYSFTVTSTGAGSLPNPAPTITVPDGGGTACVVVYRSFIGLTQGAEEVVITEGANEPNFALTAINTIRFLDNLIMNNGGYNDFGVSGGVCLTNNCLDDFETFGSRRATVYINNDMARRVTFTNTFTPPTTTGCTYTKGWYRNNGSSTVIAVDGRTIAQAQAIFNATPGKPGTVTFGDDNTLLNLYQQLLAALNNLGGDANEDNGPAAVDAAIDAAQNGTGGAGTNITTTLTQTEMSDLINTLSAFNEGTFVGWPHCDDN